MPTQEDAVHREADADRSLRLWQVGRASTALRLFRSRAAAVVRPKSQEDRNVRCFFADIACQGVLAGAGAAYLSVFAVRLGASTLQVSLLSSLPALLLSLAAVPAGRYVARQRRVVPVLIRFAVLFDLAYLAIAGVPWLGSLAAPAIVVIWSLAALANAVGTVAFVATMGEAIAPHRRAAFISTRYAIHASVAAVTLQVTGAVLTHLPFPLGYQAVFLASFGFALGSAFALSRVRIPDQTPVAEARRASLRCQLQALRVGVRSEPAFFGYLGSATVYRLGLNLPTALYSVFWVNHLHLTDGTIATFTTLNYVFTVIGYYFWGRVSQRRGRAFATAAACFGLSLYPLLTGLARSPALIYVASIAGGFAGAGVNVAFLDVLLATAPADRRSLYVAMDTSTANGVACLGPLIGSLLDGAIGIRPALCVAFGVRFLGASLFARRPVGARAEGVGPQAPPQGTIRHE